MGPPSKSLQELGGEPRGGLASRTQHSTPASARPRRRATGAPSVAPPQARESAALNYRSQKAVRIREGSGGSGRKGEIRGGGGGWCPVGDPCGLRPPDGGRGRERPMQPRA